MLEIIFSDYRPYIQDGLAIILVIAALIWGGGPERLFALTWLFLFEFCPLIYQSVSTDSEQLITVNVFYAALDFLAGISLVIGALYANRNYMLWIAAMQVLAMTAHVAHTLIDTISPVAYVTMVVAPGWLQLLIFSIGLARHIQRKRKYGSYRDWRISRQWLFEPKNTGRRWTFIGLLGHDFFAARHKR